MALLHRVLRITEVIAVELQQGVVVVVRDGEDGLEHRLQPRLLATLGRHVLLEELLVRAPLDLDEIGDLDDRRNLAKVLAGPTPALDRTRHTPSALRRLHAAGCSTPPFTGGVTLVDGGSRPRSTLARAQGGYLTSTVAPTSSIFFFIGLGAPSTRSLASLRPRPVSSRTTLMTWIFFSPAADRITSNSVFSSVAAAPPPAAPP